MDWDNSQAEKDSYARFVYGILPAKDKADFAPEIFEKLIPTIMVQSENNYSEI